MNYLLLWYVIFWLIHRIPVLFENSLYRVIAFGFVSVAFMLFFNATSSIRTWQSYSFSVGIYLAYSDEKICLNTSQIKKRYGAIEEKIGQTKFGFILLLISVALLAIKQSKYVRNSISFIFNSVNMCIYLLGSLGVLLIVLSLEKNSIGTLRSNWNLLKRALLPVGAVSFELYLVHGYALSVFSSDLSAGLSVFIFISISVVGTIIFHLFNSWLEKMLKDKLIEKPNNKADGGRAR